ncbi:LOW QUALITY PROTEIN: hypothetical protein HID58_048251, partial [Brassica napus]
IPEMPGLVSVKTPANAPQLHPSQTHILTDPIKNLYLIAKKESPEVSSAAVLNVDNPSLESLDFGPFLIKLARDAIASSEGPNEALDYAIRATKSGSDSEHFLDLAMSLHVLAPIHCNEAVMPLERVIHVTDLTRGPDHSLAAFSRHMQLGDMFSMLCQIDRSITCYEEGLKIQSQTLGDTDTRTLEIQCAHSEPASLEEPADMRLMAIICEAKRNFENALEHLVLASMAMIASRKESEVASIDVSIGNMYMSLCRFDKSVFSYKHALTMFKSSKGETHPTFRTGKLRESKSYCENALRIYNKPVPEELWRRLLARMGVMYYTLGRYEDTRNAFESAVTKLHSAEDAIEILEQLRKLGEEKLGTANPDFEDEEKRLAEL